jgi:hypothetical protein
MNISYKHFEILKELFQIQDNSFLNKVLDLVKEYRQENEVIEEDAELAELHRMAQQPTPEHIPLEVLAKEQGYDSDRLGETLRNIDHDLFADEDLEDMLKTLTK